MHIALIDSNLQKSYSTSSTQCETGECFTSCLQIRKREPLFILCLITLNLRQNYKEGLIKMYKVSTENGEYNIGFSNNDSTHPLINAVYSGYTITGNVMDGFSIEKDGKVVKADLLKVDYKEKVFLIKVNGRRVHVKAEDRFDLLLSKLGMTELASKKINSLKSPMPGLILEILVKPGQSVKLGEPIVILEAMKMENVIKAPADVMIKNIKVTKGRPVEKNELLIEFE